MCTNEDIRQEITALRGELQELAVRMEAFAHESRSDRNNLRVISQAQDQRLTLVEERVEASVLTRDDVFEAIFDGLRRIFSLKKIAAALVGTAAVMVAVREIVQVMMEVLR